MGLHENEQITVKVFRYDPTIDLSPRYETYKVPYTSQMTVLSALVYIQQNLDSSVVFRWGCRSVKCGQCGVTVNGKATLACKENIRSKYVLIEPLQPFPVIRDLVVDRTGFENRITKSKLFMIRKEPPLQEPEPIEMEVAKSFVHLSKCIECFSCISACPMISTEKDLCEGFASPVIMNKLAKRALDPRDDCDRASTALAEGAYACTTCASCKEVCPWGIETPTLSIIYLRQLLVEKGLVPRTAQDALTKIYKYGNPWKASIEGRDGWARELKVKNFSKGDKAEILLYVGCTASYDIRAQEIARSIAFVLDKAGVEFAILGNEEKCCGCPALRLGEKGLFETLVNKNLRIFDEYKIERIITLSPHSYNAFLNDYPRKSIEVQHYTQFFSDLIGQGRLTFSKRLDSRIAYHDPCFLGRINKIYEPPRRILEAITGLPPLEMPRNRENSLCCGGGGGMMWLDDISEERVSERRAREASSTNSEIVATACPFCLLSLEDGVRIIGKDDRIQVLDIAELVKRVL